ncbi:DUF4253 domain-containing protein [Actinoalloteichus hymeniacidonis]|uniref:DUF4253 family protein n=1 Tax=Actinoalloteichus hymeniacidonis TaxID=340345 RepID=A0AAC9HQI1_9PSEU|nr:DUF4253 domain-containing protein [Actinoalloteichus hymeniacidonis]AOS62735.1 putative DUF4253 family protein [Actinoalloteichus hymeniacidonis]MBB5909234.1 hypothetical protein [Actinoalloteichus hymeniacidonis]
MVDQPSTTAPPLDDWGSLFPEGTAGGTPSTPLPTGRLILPDESFARTVASRSRPALWLGDDAADAELWSRLHAEHPTSGLWPLILETAEHGGLPWETGELAPETVSDVDRFDAARVMAAIWAEWLEPAGSTDTSHLEPFDSTFPGLAPAGTSPRTAGEVADWYADLIASESARLGLVAAPRSADALAVIGWMGPVNHSEHTAPMAAVVRSWEDRFGARVVRIGFDTLDLSVAAPPTTIEHAEQVAAEHWTFCPDNIDQGPGTLRDYAEEILGKNSWSFWWD